MMMMMMMMMMMLAGGGGGGGDGGGDDDEDEEEDDHHDEDVYVFYTRTRYVGGFQMHKFHGSGSHQDPKKAGDFLGMGFLGTQWRHSFEINRGEIASSICQQVFFFVK